MRWLIIWRGAEARLAVFRRGAGRAADTEQSPFGA